MGMQPKKLTDGIIGGQSIKQSAYNAMLTATKGNVALAGVRTVTEANQAKGPDRPSHINQQCFELSQSVTALQDRLTALTGKLSPVLRNEPSATGGGVAHCAAECYLVDVAAELRRHNQALTELVEQVEDIINRLEV